MTDRPPASELADDWIVALHEAIASDTQVEPQTQRDEPGQQEVAEVRTCLNLLEDLRQANLASGGKLRQLLETSTNALENDKSEPTRIGRFEIIEELGRGGHGIILLAYDPTLKRQVALKVPRPELLSNREMRQRFVREANAAARLTHPAIVQIYELGDAGPVSYIAAEYCPGQSLASAIQASGPARDQNAAARMMLALAEAVEYANSHGVLHRDLKPANVLLVPSGHSSAPVPGTAREDSGLEPKLTDFGLAKLVDVETEYTRTGVAIGTPAYMAPEQAHGRSHGLGAPTDVYGLGTIMYELLAGRPPFIGASDLEILRKVTEEDPTALTQLRPRISVDLAAICHKCLEKEPANRYANAGALATDLRRFLAGEPTAARPATWLQRGVKWLRRYPMAAALIGVTTTALLLISVGGWVAYDRTRQARDEAEKSAMAARASNRDLRRLNYTNTVALAGRAWDRDDVADVVRRLEDCIPLKGEEDLREISWHLLWALSHQCEMTLTEHEDEIYRADCSADGKWLVTCGSQGTVRVWDVDAKARRFKLSGHTSEVNHVVIAPDSQQVASGSDDGTIRIWDLRDGSETAVLNGHHDEPITALTFSPDGKTLASGGADARIVLWNTEDWTERARLSDHTDVVECLVYAPDGSLLASASDDSTIKLWNRSNELIGTLRPREGTASCLSFTQDGKRLASAGSSDRGVRLWDVAKQTELRTLGSTYGRIHSIAFCDHDRQLAFASKDSTLHLVNITDGTQRKLLGHQGGVRSVARVPNANRLLSGGEDGTIKFWNLDQPGPERCITSPGTMRGFGYLTDGSLVFAGDDPFTPQKLAPGPAAEPQRIRPFAPMSGDFDADGCADRCWFRDGVWFIESGANRQTPLQEIHFGQSGDLPVVGDWNGDGRDDLGVTYEGYFRIRFETPSGTLHRELTLGGPLDTPLVADWDANGADELGVIHDGSILIDLALSGRPAEVRMTLPNASGGVELEPIAKAGRLDPTFGDGGVILRPSQSPREGMSLALDADGKVLVPCDRLILQPYPMAIGTEVLRLNSDGTDDMSYQLGQFEDQTNLINLGCRAIAVQSNQKTLVLFGINNNGVSSTRIRRLLDDGTIDRGFGNDGDVVIDFGPDMVRASQLAIQADEKIVTVGAARPPGTQFHEIGIARFNADGSPDSTFGRNGNGIVRTAIGSSSEARCMRILPDGRILVAGMSSNTNQTQAAIAIYLQDGNLDESFGQGGWIVAMPPEGSIATFDVAYDHAGNIFLAGSDYTPGVAARISKFGPTGELDVSFGSRGWVSVPVSPYNDSFTQIAVDSKGRIVVSGNSGLTDESHLLLMRFEPDGTLETDFRAGLRAQAAFTSGMNMASGLAVDAEDRPLVTGQVASQVGGDLFVARFLADSGEDLAVPELPHVAGGPPLQLELLQALLTPERIARARREFVAAPRGVSRMAVAPRGDFVAIHTAPDDYATILDLSTGRELATLRGHAAEISVLACSPDGRHLASGGADGQVLLWNTGTWQEIARLAGHEPSVKSLAFSPDGRQLAVGAPDGARLWRVSDAKQIQHLPLHRDIATVAFSSDGELLATGSGDRLIKLWDIAQSKLIANFTGHTDMVSMVSFNPDGRTLASCSRDGTVRLWDLYTYQELAVLNDHGKVAVHAVGFSADGRQLVSASDASDYRGELRIRTLNAGTTSKRSE